MDKAIFVFKKLAQAQILEELKPIIEVDELGNMISNTASILNYPVPEKLSTKKRKDKSIFKVKK